MIVSMTVRMVTLTLAPLLYCSAAVGCSSHYSLFGNCCGEGKAPVSQPAEEQEDWSESPADIAWDALKGVPK